ncbi:MAG: VCBS domain-containing protein, partial [Planctomycetales bacterium]|nr:VCBS domain-containing protein [Planctomycetales bacterium]
SGSVTFGEVDETDVLTSSVAKASEVTSSAAPIPAALSLALDTALVITQTGNNEGSIDWTFTLDNSLVQYLGEGETVTATYTITLDDNSGTANATTTQDIVITITGTNDQPTITLATSGAELCGAAHEDNSITLDMAFEDVDVTDVHAVNVSWGDGIIESFVLPTGDRGISLDHDYATGGIYTIVVSVVDDATGADATSLLAVVSGVGLHNGVLQIIGTAGDDHITLNQTGNGSLKVHSDFIVEFATDSTRDFLLSDISSVVAILCDGDDQLTISNRINLDTIINGGAGNDRLNGGSGMNLILGGSGEDHIIGGSGRDILLGGLGADRIVGAAGRDLLSGGRLVDASLDEDTTSHLSDLVSIQTRYKTATNGEIDAWISGADNFFDEFALDLTDDEAAADVITSSSGEDWTLLFESDIWTDEASNSKGKK